MQKKVYLCSGKGIHPMDSDLQIQMNKPLNICRASAGTGKTFTLAAYYVGLLLSGESYRSILAVTFTNKATAEMRERIIRYLHGIAEGGEDAFFARARQFMIANRQQSEQELRQRAADCFNEMLLDYDNVQVQTIDSFLQTLQSGMASALRLRTGLNTELDIPHLIAQSVDELLTSHMTDEVRVLLEKYLDVQLDNERRWDVRQSICQMAKELYNESVQELDARGEIVFDADAIDAYRTRLAEQWENNPDRKAIAQLVLPLRENDYSEWTNGKALQAAIQRLTDSVDHPKQVKADDFFRGLTDAQYEKAAAGQWTKLPQADVQAVVKATELGRQLRYTYHTYQLTVAFSYEMQLMAALRERINENLAQQNSALLAQTANTLCQALHTGDADFILEKAGIRYKHVLIDEFQDTSSLQWKVFRQLLDNLMAMYGHTVLIVGDVKQSIYRWRNGDWSIMQHLGKGNTAYGDYNNEAFTPLVLNRRSREHIVRFNLSLFKQIVAQEPNAELKDLLRAIYDEGYTGIFPQGERGNIENYCLLPEKSDGFVQFKAFPVYKRTEDDERMPVREAILRNMFDSIEQLLTQGVQASQIMILVRRNSEAREITDLHAQLAENEYPLLSATAIVSSDSFLLEASRDVQTVIKALNYLLNKDDVSAHFVTQATGRLDTRERLNTLDVHLPLYEAVSELIRLLLCAEDGRYEGTEAAYLNCLLDNVREYVMRYGSHIQDFLDYWEDTLHAKAIPAPSDNGIRILTIHSSKGLEAQTLFVPFCDWPREVGAIHPTVWCQAQPEEIAEEVKHVPITEGKAMLESDYASEYMQEHINARIDNLNMLYVALTRARDNLFISSAFAMNQNGLAANDHVGRYLLEALQMVDFIGKEDLPLTYETPYAQWQIGKPIVAPMEEQPVNGHTLQMVYNSDQVRFVQSQESLLYSEYGEEADRRAARIETGNICHEVFARLTEKISNFHEWREQLNGILDDFESQGLITSSQSRAQIWGLVSKAWQDPQMKKWFQTPFTVYSEQALYLDGKEYRPDRVMVDEERKTAIIIDYKFGGKNDKYYDQVRIYMRAMQLMGYDHVEGYLWFAQTGTLENVPMTENE